MEMEVTEYRKEPYGNRLGFAKVLINKKLTYLFVVAKDKESGDLKAFPPSQKTENGYIACWDIPRETKDKAIKQVLEVVKNMEQDVEENAASTSPENNNLPF